MRLLIGLANTAWIAALGAVVSAFHGVQGEMVARVMGAACLYVAITAALACVPVLIVLVVKMPLAGPRRQVTPLATAPARV